MNVLTQRYPDGYFFENTIFREDKTKKLKYKYMEHSKPPTSSTNGRPSALVNVELVASPLLKEYSERRITEFFEDYASYR